MSEPTPRQPVLAMRRQLARVRWRKNLYELQRALYGLIAIAALAASAGEPVLGGGLWQGIATLGTVVALGTLGAAVWARSSGAPWQTLAFFVLATSQLAVAAGVRSDGRGARAPLVWSVILAALLAIAGVYVPLLQDLLGTQALPAEQLPVAAVIGIVAYGAARAVANWLRHR